ILHVGKGKVLVQLGGHTKRASSPDGAVANRTMDLKSDVILKATKMDGVYDEDPKKVPGAKMFAQINYLDVLARGLAVMDTTAISMCMDNDLPIIVFNLNVPGNLKRVVLGEKVGSLVAR